MSINSHTERASTPTVPTPPQSPRRYGRAWTALLAAGLLSASIIGFAAAHGPGASHQAADTHADPSAPLDDAHLRQIVHYLMARGTEPQKTQIADIAKAAAIDLQAIEQQARQARGRRMELLLGDTIDRDALERTRIAEMQLTDQRSQRVDRALIELAGVLTPQQRAHLSAHVQTLQVSGG